MVSETFINLSDEKKQKIEKALLKEFSTYPLAKAQVARIVKDAEIARGAFYKYFGDLKDAYSYLYGLAMKEVHMGPPSRLREFDPEAFYKMTVDFINQTENSVYLDLVKMHISQNQAFIGENKKKKLAFLNLNSKVWAAMVLTHEAIDLALFDKKNKDKILKRYHESLCLLEGK
ncbi:TetR/AcrR family transcriptional regulator [Lactobacillus isalae]|uniref:TetR/AcrR family transcriptional regulator n=1 Tax=Lactobacillus isalae TaxID=2993455 RepID=UPI0024A90A4E|nr:TetR/AcrR family transcriptional regulator [Lactobacillus isalae]